MKKSNLDHLIPDNSGENERDNLHEFLYSYQKPDNSETPHQDEFPENFILELKKLNSILENLNFSSSRRILPGWITEDELITKINRSRRTLRSWRLAGKIPYSCLGEVVMYKIKDIEDKLNIDFGVK